MAGRRYVQETHYGQYPSNPTSADHPFQQYAESYSDRASPADSSSYASTPGRPRPPSPVTLPYSKPFSYTRPGNASRSPPPQRGEASDNPLYEDIRLPVFARQGIASTNPLYGNDPYHTPDPSCMTEFLRPKGPRKVRKMPQRDKLGRFVKSNPAGGRHHPNPQPPPSNYWPRNPSPPFSGPMYRQQQFRLPGSDPKSYVVRYPPARFSPLQHWRSPPEQEFYMPPSYFASTQRFPAASNKRDRQQQRGPGRSSMVSRQRLKDGPPQRPRVAVQSVKDLVAAVRSDQNLLKAEVRKDGGREPRIPGDRDRYFAPRKGDIVVHSTETADNKLVEYFDENRMVYHLQAGDKLVRVKYDNYKIPDHLMITSKLYIYANSEWIYLGKAVQTIKTA